MRYACGIPGYDRAQWHYDNARPLPEGNIIDVEIVEDFHQWKSDIENDDKYYLTPDRTVAIVTN